MKHNFITSTKCDLKKFIKNKKTLYFANEGFKVSSQKDAYRVEMIWLIKKNLIKCPGVKDIWAK